MKTTKFELLGWLVAAAIAGVIVASGFQATSSTFAVVDGQKVAVGSDAAKLQNAELQKASGLRTDLLTFASSNPVISVDQLVRVKTLWLKTPPTDADKADLDRLKKDITDTCAKFLEIKNKSTRTPDEISELDQFNQWIEHTNQQIQQMDQEFRSDLDQMRRTYLLDDEAKMRVAAAIVAKEQNFSIVFDTSAAPYGAHDITDATLLQMNKK